MKKSKIHGLSVCAEIIKNLDMGQAQSRVLRELFRAGKQGLSSFEIESASRIPHNSVSATLKNLALKGWIFESKRIKGEKTYLRRLIGIDNGCVNYPDYYPYNILDRASIKCDDNFMFREQLKIINQVFR